MSPALGIVSGKGLEAAANALGPSQSMAVAIIGHCASAAERPGKASLCLGEGGLCRCRHCRQRPTQRRTL